MSFGMLRMVTWVSVAAIMAHTTPAEAQSKRGRTHNSSPTAPRAGAGGAHTLGCDAQDSDSSRERRGKGDKQKKKNSERQDASVRCEPQLAPASAIPPVPPPVTPAPTETTTTPGTSTSTLDGSPAQTTGTTPTTLQGTITTTAGGSLTVTGITGDALLDGLLNVNIQQLLLTVQLIANVNLQNAVVDISDVLNNVQINALLQALNMNPQASIVSNEITGFLLQSGLIAPDETVVGVDRSAGVYDNHTLTEALQRRGVLRPGERVVGVKGPRVYKAKRWK